MLKMAQSSARWCFNFTKWCTTPQELLHATACIQEEEKTRLGKFVFKDDLKSSLVGRLMMRKFVADACGLRYNNVKFGRDEKGRPIIVEYAGEIVPKFNVSHQGDYTVFAGEVDLNLKLGIDVMKLKYTGGKPVSEFFRIMKRNFSSDEWKQIYQCKLETDQLNTFLRLWSLKESYVKAIGVGITVKLDELSFKISTPLKVVGIVVADSKLYVNNQKLEDWYFEETLIDEMHCVSVATNKNIKGGEFKEVDLGFLMEKSIRLLEEDEGYCAQYYKKMDKTF